SAAPREAQQPAGGGCGPAGAIIDLRPPVGGTLCLAKGGEILLRSSAARVRGRSRPGHRLGGERRRRPQRQDEVDRTLERCRQGNDAGIFDMPWKIEWGYY